MTKGDDRVKRVLAVLILASLLSCSMAAARALYSGHGMFVFLGWNLVLAWAPLGLSLVLVGRYARPEPPTARRRKLRSGGSWALAGLWLLFFPNAPYIVTDLIHLRERAPVPIWFDAAMVFTFALTGICIAFVSLLLLHRLVERRRGPIVGWLFVGVVWFLTGFGIYLGRYQRWNSWDLVSRPGALLADVAGRFLHPFDHPRTFGLTLMMATVFAVAYLMLFTLASLGPIGAVAAASRADGADRG